MATDKPKSAKRWTVDQRRLMVWLATPIMDRMPVTQGLLAQEIGRDQATLSDWKRIPGFWDEVAALVDQHWLDDYPEIVEAFKSEAKKGSYNHQRTYFEMMGKYAPKTQTEVSGEITIKVEYEDAS